MSDAPRRGTLAAVGLAALLLVAHVLAAGSRPPGRTTAPLDPASVQGDGTRALALLLAGSGVRVVVTTAVPPAGEPVTVLVLDDALGPAQRAQLLTWIDAGGSLVVTDPSSALHPGADLDGGAGPAFGTWPRGTCTIDALAAVAGLDALTLEDSLAYPLGPDDRSCFGDGRRAFVLERPQGAGRVTALGGPSPFLNRGLARGGNAALALALLRRDERRSVVVLQPELLAGHKTLAQLVPRRVWMALAQLGVAFVALAWWRSRRLGAPVGEPDPVVVPGSELVVAAGALAARAGHAARSAEVLRADARRALAERLGVDPTTPTAVLDQLACARSGSPSGTVGALLDGRSADDARPPDEASLVALAIRLDRLRQEVP